MAKKVALFTGKRVLHVSKVCLVVGVALTACSTPQDAALQNAIHQKKEREETEQQTSTATQQLSSAISGQCLVYFPKEAVANTFACQQLVVKLIGESNAEIATAHPGEKGKFVFHNIPLGKYSVAISKSWSFETSPKGLIIPGESFELKVYPSQ